MALCLSVCLSVTSRYCIEKADRAVVADKLLSVYPTLCWKKIRISPKLTVRPSATAPSSKFREKKSPWYTNRRKCCHFHSQDYVRSRQFITLRIHVDEQHYRCNAARRAFRPRTVTCLFYVSRLSCNVYTRAACT